MKAFISYSLNQTELYVLSVLAKKLNDKGFTVSSSYSKNDFSNILDFHSFSQIIGANLFIGIISCQSKDSNRVFEEWKIANSKNVPALLLVEDNIPLSQELENFPNTVRFNRNNPDSAIENVKNKIFQANNTSDKNNNVAAWVLGGLGLLVLINLLSKD